MTETIQALRDAYVSAVIANANAIDRGDSKSANQAYALANEAVSQLRSLGSSGTGVILSLLEHPLARVRASAAVQLLQSHPSESIRVLEEVARLPGTEGLGAELTIREWKRTSQKANEQS